MNRSENKTSFLAGICLHDLIQNHDWKSKIFNRSENQQFVSEICEKIIKMELSNYNFRALQSKIVGKFLFVIYMHHPKISEEIFEQLTDKISDGSF